MRPTLRSVIVHPSSHPHPLADLSFVNSSVRPWLSFFSFSWPHLHFCTSSTPIPFITCCFVVLNGPPLVIFPPHFRPFSSYICIHLYLAFVISSFIFLLPFAFCPCPLSPPIHSTRAAHTAIEHTSNCKKYRTQQDPFYPGSAQLSPFLLFLLSSFYSFLLSSLDLICCTWSDYCSLPTSHFLPFFFSFLLCSFLQFPFPRLIASTFPSFPFVLPHICPVHCNFSQSIATSPLATLHQLTYLCTVRLNSIFRLSSYSHAINPPTLLCSCLSISGTTEDLLPFSLSPILATANHPRLAFVGKRN